MKRLCVAMTWLFCLLSPGPLMAQEAPGTIMTVGKHQAILVPSGGMGWWGMDGGGLAVDDRGHLFVAPYRITLSDGKSTPFLLPSPSDVLKIIGSFGDGMLAARNAFVRTTGTEPSGSGIVLPTGMAMDLKGNLYIAAPFDQRIRRVDSDGIIWTAAGSSARVYHYGTSYDSVSGGGYAGDGGPARLARLYKPSDIALDPQGNLYIADSGNNRIRMVNREGYISTFAGSGEKPMTAGAIGDGGQSILAVLDCPMSVAADLSGNVYASELYGHRVRRISPDGGHTITTFAGTGQAGYSGDGGPAAQAQLNNPMGIAVDVEGVVYIADRGNHRVRKVDLNGVITTFAGNGTSAGDLGDGGPALQGGLARPRDLTVDAQGYVYISHDDTPSQAANGFFGPVRRVSPAKLFGPPSIRLSSTSMVFEASNVNTPVEQTLAFTNPAKETPLLVEVVADRDYPEFMVITPTHFLVPPGGAQEVKVRYTPSTLRSVSATLKVYHNGVESNPLTVSLSGSGPIKSADFDKSGKVDFDDFFLFAMAFGQSATGENAPFDLDVDGKINFDDFFLFAAKFGK